MNKITIFKFSALAAVLSAASSTTVSAHGWSEFPNARQNICYEQGGIWSGSPPNAACAQAKNISGSYPFVQKNEYSKNITNFNNMNAVRADIPDGTLCYANDPQKKGMGAPHTGWTRTEVKAGTFNYVFKATAAHNPSFWEFYLTKPNADLSKALAWGDLELIQEYGNVPVNGGKYRMNVTIPQDRLGDAILYVRWQRNDQAGEGFYNCSDITIVNDGVTNPNPTPDPGPTPEANLVKGDSFIPAGFVKPKVGDVVKYDIYNQYGNIARTFKVEVDTSNYSAWDRLLASEINGWHADNKDGSIFIGDWHEGMNHYMYFNDNPSRNFFNSEDGRAYAIMSIENEDTGVPSLNVETYEVIESDSIVNAGELFIIHSKSPLTLTQTQGTPLSVSHNGNHAVVDTDNASDGESISFIAASEGKQTTVTFSISGDTVVTPEPPVTGKTWDSSKVYLGGEFVIYNGIQYKAQWWIQGGYNPESAYAKDKWGVWRPVN